MEDKKKISVGDLFNTKKKKIITGCVAIAMILATAGGVYAFNKEDSTKLVLKKEYTKTIKIEYGDSINQELKTYLNTTNLDKEDKKDVLAATKIAVKTKDDKKVFNDAGKDYPAVGNYKVVLSYKDEAAVVRVKIEDTTKPTIDGVNSIDIVQGTDLNTYDFNSLFTIKDLSKVDTKIDHSKIDVNTVGSYKLNITATDSFKNESSKEVDVNITAKPSADEEVVTETVTNADGSKSVKTSTKKKATTSSSSGSSTNSSSNKTSGTTSTSKPSTNTSTPSTPSTPSAPSTPATTKMHSFWCRECMKEFRNTSWQVGYDQVLRHQQIDHGWETSTPAYYHEYY